MPVPITTPAQVLTAALAAVEDITRGVLSGVYFGRFSPGVVKPGEDALYWSLQVSQEIGNTKTGRDAALASADVQKMRDHVVRAWVAWQERDVWESRSYGEPAGGWRDGDVITWSQDGDLADDQLAVYDSDARGNGPGWRTTNEDHDWLTIAEMATQSPRLLRRTRQDDDE